MKIRRTFVVALLALALAIPSLPVQALPVEGYEISYYQWDSQLQGYVMVGQEILYCDMVRPYVWGQTEFGIDDCGAIKEHLVFGCSTGSFSYETRWWTGLVWADQAVCHG